MSRCKQLLGLALLVVALGVPSQAQAEPADPAAALKVHMISATGEYQSEPSLKEYQQYLEKNYRVTCTASWSKDGASTLSNLDDLESADLLLVFARRMKLDEPTMARVKKHWESGKPVVGIRTAGHAFSREENEIFDRQVLGGNYQGHYGNEPVKVTSTEAGKAHPILDGVGEFTSLKLYKAGPLPEQTVVLQMGNNAKGEHPVTLVNTYKGARVFFTALGVPSDFEDENFRRMLTNAVFWTTHRDPEKMKK